MERQQKHQDDDMPPIKPGKTVSGRLFTLSRNSTNDNLQAVLSSTAGRSALPTAPGSFSESAPPAVRLGAWVLGKLRRHNPGHCPCHALCPARFPADDLAPGGWAWLRAECPQPRTAWSTSEMPRPWVMGLPDSPRHPDRHSDVTQERVDGSNFVATGRRADRAGAARHGRWLAMFHGSQAPTGQHPRSRDRRSQAGPAFHARPRPLPAPSSLGRWGSWTMRSASWQT